MKKIYLIRHAKSDWKKDYLSDFERGLNKRGKQDASFMAKRMKNFGVFPDIIYSSPAKRAKATAKIFAKELDYPKSKIIYDESLYLPGEINNYIKLIKSIPNKFNEVFIFGHNPTITEVGEVLTNTILTNMPTCSIVCIEFEIDDFSKITQGKVSFFDYPKKHKSK